MRPPRVCVLPVLVTATFLLACASPSSAEAFADVGLGNPGCEGQWDVRSAPEYATQAAGWGGAAHRAAGVLQDVSAGPSDGDAGDSSLAGAMGSSTADDVVGIMGASAGDTTGGAEDSHGAGSGSDDATVPDDAAVPDDATVPDDAAVPADAADVPGAVDVPSAVEPQLPWPPQNSSGPLFVLGTNPPGEGMPEAFNPIEDGAAVTAVKGDQGSWMLVIAAATNLLGSNVERANITARLESPDGATVYGSLELRKRPVLELQGLQYLMSQFLVLDDEIAVWDGKPAVLHVELQPYEVCLLVTQDVSVVPKAP